MPRRSEHQARLAQLARRPDQSGRRRGDGGVRYRHHGRGDTYPYFPGVSYRDWKLDDSAGHPVEVVRRIRDDIAERIKALVDELTGP